MTSTQTQIRRDTGTNVAAFTGAEGEVIYDKTNKRLSLQDGATAGGILVPNYSDVQKQAFCGATAGGTANALTAAFTPPTVGESSLQKLTILCANTNTASATIAIDGRSACTLKKIKNGALSNLEAGDLFAGMAIDIIYIGSSNYLVTSLGQQSVTPSGLVPLATTNASGVHSFTFGSSLITSTYNKYVIEADSLCCSGAGGNGIVMDVSTNNGSTWSFNDGSHCYGSVYGPSATNPGGGGGVAPSQNQNYFDLFSSPMAGKSMGNAAPELSSFSMKFTRGSASAGMNIEWTAQLCPLGSGGGGVIAVCGGTHKFSTSAAINAVRFWNNQDGGGSGPGSSTLSGNFHLYGITGT